MQSEAFPKQLQGCREAPEPWPPSSVMDQQGISQEETFSHSLAGNKLFQERRKGVFGARSSNTS